MNLTFRQAKFQLKSAQLLTLDDSLHAEIECVTGSLWITQDGDPRDVMLSAGARHCIDRTSRVVVFATSDAELAISSHQLAMPDLSYRFGVLARLFAGTAAGRVSAAAAPACANCAA